MLRLWLEHWLSIKCSAACQSSWRLKASMHSTAFLLNTKSPQHIWRCRVDNRSCCSCWNDALLHVDYTFRTNVRSPLRTLIWSMVFWMDKVNVFQVVSFPQPNWKHTVRTIQRAWKWPVECALEENTALASAWVASGVLWPPWKWWEMQALFGSCLSVWWSYGCISALFGTITQWCITKTAYYTFLCEIHQKTW